MENDKAILLSSDSLRGVLVLLIFARPLVEIGGWECTGVAGGVGTELVVVVVVLVLVLVEGGESVAGAGGDKFGVWA